MPIKKCDPFLDPLAGLSLDINPYTRLLREADLPLLYGPSLLPCAGRWREHFTQSMGHVPEKLVLEIGSHLGEVILQMAERHPRTAFLGCDITFKRVVKVAQKTQRAGHKNLLSILANAKGLDQLFSPGELDGVIVFFPDPWIKKQRQAKNRLLRAEFFETLASKLHASAHFWFKTDCQPYFEEVRDLLAEAGWTTLESRTGLTSETYVSRFQRLFQARGLPTYELVCLPPLKASVSSNSFRALDVLG